ncbi:hypothetical protein CMT41_15000 [Colwellia sp. MT41]|uniref:Uncharacterized protein n=1 Tax=Colwellia marinimaniae TaxID=1513592 RepID=A0ABQ0MQH4_9GAMM|nr:MULTISPECIES: hypothetical protein [Colwellia]ALO35884.1 hypothetical protein CMT41_15000 [Colwellia sp. MT41]GAW94622.1 hypothetical protein MTCD1_00218 [Colwellia marinimaniae]
MKHLLILIVAVALYLHFYPNKEVTQFYNEQKQVLLDGFAKFSDTKVRLKADKIYLDLVPELAAFSEAEVARLKEITSSRENVKTFYFTICKTEKRDVDFHINNEKKVCSTISRYANML